MIYACIYTFWRFELASQKSRAIKVTDAVSAVHDRSNPHSNAASIPAATKYTANLCNFLFHFFFVASIATVESREQETIVMLGDDDDDDDEDEDASYLLRTNYSNST